MEEDSVLVLMVVLVSVLSVVMGVRYFGMACSLVASEQFYFVRSS